MPFTKAILPVAFALFLVAPASAQEANRPPLIEVTGHGEVTGAPDTAFVTSGVTTQGETARAALDANTAAMTDLVGALKAAGIADRDIQTSNFSVSPNYVYNNQPDQNGYTHPPRIDGYTVTNQVGVRVRDLSSLGEVLDKAVTVGANTINGISFSVEDASALYDAARKAAFADARHKADLYAQAADVVLGGIASLSENQNVGQPPQPYMMKAVAEAAASVPVQAGELTFSIDVSVSWEIEQ
jgi:uncharacterized protein YggE